MLTKNYYYCLALFIMPLSATAQNQLVVGHISFARGNSAAQHTGMEQRLLGQGAEVYAGDNIQTAERSFVIIDFIDGAKITVRPNSSFSIDKYNLQSNTQKAMLVLHEGGLQAKTGKIAAQKADDFQIKANQSTVISSQAEYSLQVCDAKCVEQERQKAAQAALIIARIVDIKGEVTAKNTNNKDAKVRKLSLGDALYNSDMLVSLADSYALMIFPDGEKLTVQANTQLLIQNYAYHVAGKKDNILFRLIKGGMRALTGVIGKQNNGAYTIDTPVATIGIRGTGFDLNCVGDCVADASQNKDSKGVEQGQAEGLYSQVWQGEIVLRNEQGETALITPNSNYIASINAAPVSIPALPENLQRSPAPRPDSNKSDAKQLFSAKTPASSAGVYLAVQKGQATMQASGSDDNEAKSTSLKENQQAFSGEQGGSPTPLSEPTLFQQENNAFDAAEKTTNNDSLLENDHENANAPSTEQCAE